MQSSAFKFLVFSLFFIVISCDDAPVQSLGPEQDPVPEIHAMLNTIIQDWEGQDIFTAEFQDLTGIQLRITQPPHQTHSERVLLQLNSNDKPDVVEILPEYLPRLVQDGQLLPLDFYLATSEFGASIEPEYLEAIRHSDGFLYSLPARDGGGCVAYIRKDWLDALGLAPPRTWDELFEVIRAFTEDDPDGNGIDDTWGYTDVNGGSEDWYNRLVMGPGRVEIYYSQEAGAWVDGLSEEKAWVGLDRLRLIYSLGYMDRDAATNTTFSARTKFINGEVGIFTYWANHWAINLQERTSTTDSNVASIIAIPPLEGGYYIQRIAPHLAILSSSRSPQTVFDAFFDFQWDKGPGQTLFTYGVKGYHWDVDARGNMQFLINQEDPYKAQFTKSFVPPGSTINGWVEPMQPDTLVSTASNILRQHSRHDRQFWGGPFFNDYYLQVERRLKPEIIIGYVTGKLSRQEARQEYEKRSEALFTQRILEELNS